MQLHKDERRQNGELSKGGKPLNRINPRIERRIPRNRLDKTRLGPAVLQGIPADNFEVYADFHAGSVRPFGAKLLIKTGTVFEPLQDIGLFKTKLAIVNTTEAWDAGGNSAPVKCLGLDPFTIFELPAVPDPLKKS